MHTRTTHARVTGLGCRVLQRAASHHPLAQASSPGTKARQLRLPGREEGCSLAPSSQPLPGLFQGWAEASQLVTLPTSSGLTPLPPPPQQEPRAEGAYCWALEVGWAQSCELESIYSVRGTAHSLGTAPTPEPQELGTSSAGWAAGPGTERVRTWKRERCQGLQNI